MKDALPERSAASHFVRLVCVLRAHDCQQVLQSLIHLAENGCCLKKNYLCTQPKLTLYKRRIFYFYTILT